MRCRSCLKDILPLSRHTAWLILAFALCSACTSSSQDQANISIDLQALSALQDEALSLLDLSPYDPARDTHPKSASFDEMFEPVGLFEFSDSVLFSALENIVVLDSGYILGSDPYAMYSIMYSGDGTIHKILDPSFCHPGFSYTPGIHLLDSSGNVRIAGMGSDYGFSFTGSGECIGRFPMAGWNMQGAALVNDQLYVHKLERDRWHVWAVKDSTQHTLVEGTDFVRVNWGRITASGDLLAMGDSALALVFRHSPLVHRVSLSSGAVTEIGRAPEDFIAIEENIPTTLNRQDEIIAARERLWEGSSRTAGLFAVSDDILMTYHINRTGPFVSNPQGMGIRLMDHHGNHLHDEPINLVGYESGVKGTSHGLVYRMLINYWDEEERLNRNPPLLIYRVTP